MIHGNSRLEEILFGHVILNNVQQVKTLLKYGVNPNCQDEQGNTPLHILTANTQLTGTSISGDSWLGMIRLLHYYGAHVNARNCAQLTALMMAASNGHTQMVDQLIRMGGDVNLTNAEGNTALFSAVSRGQSEVVDVLLQSGSCDLKSCKQGSGLIKPLRKVYDTVVGKLCQGKGHVAQRTTDSMLIVASARGHNTIVTSLLNFGFDANVVGWFQKTPLHHAARCGHVETTRVLLEFSAAAGCQDTMGMTPLLLAASKCHLQRYREVMTLLIESGCSISEADIYGRNVFHVMAAQGCADIVHLLLSRGHFKPADAASCHGVTPILTAIRSNRLSVLKVMLSFNWSVTSEFYFQNSRRPLLWFPLHEGYTGVALLLVSAGANLHGLLGNCRQRHQCSDLPWLHRNILDDEVALNRILEMAAMPRSLIDLCRIKIRRELGHNISHQVSTLPLPQGLRNEILMKGKLSLECSSYSARHVYHP